ncbi:KR domain-containing protein [Xylaria cubensis]|nr:KR domain-containing protein [Xylaria cubensis]
MTPIIRRPLFSSKAQYLVVGGFGALGKPIINFMVERGARYFTVLSRHKPNGSSTASFLSDMHAHGVSIYHVSCDVSDLASVTTAVRELLTRQPLNGIVHAATTYDALSFDKLTASEWNAGVAAKVLGTRNLHAATIGMPLDLFVMLTSISSIVGIGTVGTDPITINTIKRNKFMTHSEYEFVQLLEPEPLRNGSTLSDSHKWLGASQDLWSMVNLVRGLDPVGLAASGRLGDNESQGLTPRWQLHARTAHVVRWYEDAKKHLTDDQQTDNKSFVTTATAKAVADMGFIGPASVNPGESVAKYGVDSLIAAEIRNWFKNVLGVDINMLQMLSTQTTMRMLASQVIGEAFKSS